MTPAAMAVLLLVLFRTQNISFAGAFRLANHFRVTQPCLQTYLEGFKLMARLPHGLLVKLVFSLLNTLKASTVPCYD